MSGDKPQKTEPMHKQTYHNRYQKNRFRPEQEYMVHFTHTREGIRRMTVPKALYILGVDPGLYHVPKINEWRNRPGEIGRKGTRSFWARHADELEQIAWSTKEAYRKTMRRVHPDRIGTDADAKAVIRAYEFLKKQFRLRGVEI